MIPMDNIDRFIQCLRHDQEMEDGSVKPGHNFAPLPAYIEDQTLHMDIHCKYCGMEIPGEKPYQGESPEQIYEMYGFRLDDPYNPV